MNPAQVRNVGRARGERVPAWLRPLFKHPEDGRSALFEVVNRHQGLDIRATTERTPGTSFSGGAGGGRGGRERSERFFWWRTACNTWQYLVSGPRSPAGSTLFYSIRGAAIRFSAPRMPVVRRLRFHGGHQAVVGPPPHPCTPARLRPDPLACLQE